MRALRHIEGYVQVVDNRGRYFLRGPRGFIQGAGFTTFSSVEEARSDARSGLIPSLELVGLSSLSIGMAENDADVLLLRRTSPWILIQAQRGVLGECAYELYGDHALGRLSVASPGRCGLLGAYREWRQFQEWEVADYAASELYRQGASPVYPARFELHML